MRGDVGVPDLFKWRSEKTMLRTNLQGSRRSMPCVKFVTRITVIDYNNVAVRELARDILEPIERRGNDFRLITRGSHRQFLQVILQLSIANRLIEECQLVACQDDKLLQPIGRSSFGLLRYDQMHRHGIEKFIRKMNSGKWLKRLD